MTIPQRLAEGFQRFRKNVYPVQQPLFDVLKDGQSPRTLVIACADSRVDPAAIFSASPGELFVLRNVANLVPPFEDDGSFHGTSAGLEFAVTGLRVRDIVILGHGQCGGVSASLASAEDQPVGRFIHPWVELMAPARAEVLANSSLTPEERQRQLEFAAIRHSLGNLQSFPFICEALEAGQLNLHGAWFSIAEGVLLWLDEKTGRFEPVTEDPAFSR